MTGIFNLWPTTPNKAFSTKIYMFSTGLLHLPALTLKGLPYLCFDVSIHFSSSGILGSDAVLSLSYLYLKLNKLVELVCQT